MAYEWCKLQNVLTYLKWRNYDICIHTRYWYIPVHETHVSVGFVHFIWYVIWQFILYVLQTKEFYIFLYKVQIFQIMRKVCSKFVVLSIAKMGIIINLHVVREMTGIKPINLESNLECPKGLDKPLWSVVCIACLDKPLALWSVVCIACRIVRPLYLLINRGAKFNM